MRFDGWVATAAMTRFMQEIRVANDVARSPAWLRPLLDRGVISNQGYLLLKDANLTDRVIAQHPDATGVEAFLNHFHIDAEDEPLTDLAIALTAAETLADALRQLDDRGTARVIVSRSVGSELPTSTVRFHRLRHGETWLTADLEQYRQEAVGYLDVPLRPEPATIRSR